MSRSLRYDWFLSTLRSRRGSKGKQRAAPRLPPHRRRLQLEGLEDRRMLANVTVANVFDTVNGATSSITALIANPGADGISLREALLAANATAGADVIDFATGLSGGTLSLTGGELEISQSVTIDARSLTGNVTINANLASRIFFITAEAGDVTLGGLTITGGRVASLGGGAILSASTGVLRLNQSTVSGNRTEASDAAGGGIWALAGSVELVQSTVSGNRTTGAGAHGGGIAVGFFGVGGELTLTQSTVSGNSTSGDSAHGGGIWALGTVTLTQSTVSGNTTSGPVAHGGGIYGRTVLTLTQSTITQNRVLSPTIRFTPQGAVVSSAGGGVYQANPTSTNHPFTISNSIVAANTAAGPHWTGDLVTDQISTFTVNYSLIGVDNDFTFVGNVGNLIGTPQSPLNPLLSPLANDGGPTQTHAPLAGSPAIDAGDPSLTSGFDQRGAPFVRLFDGRADIGAVERQPITFVVDTAEDVDDGDHSPGNLSLREAILLANATTVADLIRFDAALSGRTIVLGGAEYVITQAVTIDARSLAQNVTIDANQASRIFNITATTGDFTLAGLTLTGGRTTANNSGRGGAIRSGTNNQLTLIQSTVSGNSTTGDFAFGGGIYARAAVTLTQSTVSGNSTTGYASGGGGIFAGGAITVTESTVSGNSTAGISAGGGGISANGAVTLTRSTVSGNSAPGSSARGGGIRAGSTVTLTQSTIANNHAPGGGGVYQSFSPANVPIVISGSIVAGNTAFNASSGPDIVKNSHAASTLTLNYSLIGTAVAPAAGGNNVITDNPQLGPLANNGGPTQTRALLAGSPAIDAGDPSLTGGVDQRGAPFARVFGGRIDIGAYEAGNTGSSTLFAWTSPAAGVVTLVGTIWETELSETDQNWTVLVGSRWITGGTLLHGQYSLARPFSITFGAGGPGAVRNIPVAAGETVTVLVNGGRSGDVDEEIAASFHEDSTPHYELGTLPPRFVANGQPLEFIVDRPAGLTGPFTVQTSSPPPAGLISFDPATGRFRYVPAVADRFDFDVLFQIGDGGTFAAPTRQLVTISPSEIESGIAIVSTPRPLPQSDSRDYITVSETVNNLPASSTFNARPQTTTRNVEISGKTIHLTPGHANGLYERIAYADPSGQSIINANIRSLVIYAETLVLGGRLRLPQTDVTIYARTLQFVDSPGVTASINTTPLDYQTASGSGAIGGRGEDAGDVQLHVEAVVEPAGSSAIRFILNGARGQTAGAGAPGIHGINAPVINMLTELEGVYWAAFQIEDVVNRPPGPFPPWPANLVSVQGQWNDVEFQKGSLPTDGQNATPGGTPGNGGNGGQLRISSTTLIRPNSFIAAAGIAGQNVASQPGGNAGLPRNFNEWELIRISATPNSITPIDYPPSGHTLITWHDRGTFIPGQTNSGVAWIAAPDGVGGSNGSFQSVSPTANHWLQPATLRAMVAHAKDAYVNGHVEFAAQAFGEYQRLVDSLSVPPPPEFAELRSEIALYAHRAASGLDYFGNPPGWAPTLSFAANFQAFQNTIDNDLRLLHLTRFLQNSSATQESLVAALTKSLAKLDTDIALAVSALDKAQALLPELQTELHAIDTQIRSLQLSLQQRDLELQAEAASNLPPSPEEQSFWKKTLSFLAKVLPVIPKVGPIAGPIVGAISKLLDDSSSVGLVKAFGGVTDSFLSLKLESLKSEIAALKAKSKPESNPSMTQEEKEEFKSVLEPLSKIVSKTVEALTGVVQAAQVPKSTLQQELTRIKARDNRFNDLVEQIKELNENKEKFAQNLANASQAIADAVQRITANVSAAGAFNAQLNQVAGGLRHDVVEHVEQLERNAKERLLRYQYYMAKAYEYELLQPYTGNFQLANLMDAITSLIANHPADANWLDNPTNFAALKGVYEGELRNTADQIWTQLNTSAPQRTSQIAPRLSPDQLNELNLRGELTINLIEMGFISPDRQNVKLLDMGVQQITAATSGPFAQLANVRFGFEHSGTSIVQSGGILYTFQHHASDDANRFFWATDYDAISRQLVQSEISPSQIASIAALLGLNPAAVTSDQAGRLYAHPGAWADITIRKTETLLPAGVDVNVTDLQLFVRYESDQSLPATVRLEVRGDDEMAPRIHVGRQDKGGLGDGAGAFTRFFDQGQPLTLIAEPVYGRFEFSEWRNAQGQTISASSTLTLPMNQSTQVFAVYAPILPGDFSGDGVVTSADLGVWKASFGAASPADAPAGDADADRDVDGADFLVWQRNLGRGLAASSSPEAHPTVAAAMAASPEPTAATAGQADVAGVVDNTFGSLPIEPDATAIASRLLAHDRVLSILPDALHGLPSIREQSGLFNRLVGSRSIEVLARDLSRIRQADRTWEWSFDDDRRPSFASGHVGRDDLAFFEESDGEALEEADF